MTLADVRLKYVPSAPSTFKPRERRTAAIPVTLHDLSVNMHNTASGIEKDWLPIFESHLLFDGNISPLVQLDIEDAAHKPLSDDVITHIINTFEKTNHTALAFKSTNGVKIHLYVPDIAEIESHDMRKAARKRIWMLCSILLGGIPLHDTTGIIRETKLAVYGIMRNIVIDASIGDDARICYAPHNENVYVNTDAKPMAIPPNWIEGNKGYQYIARASAEHEPEWGNAGIRIVQVLKDLGYDENVRANALWTFSQNCEGKKKDSDDSIYSKALNHATVKASPIFVPEDYMLDNDVRIHDTDITLNKPSVPIIALEDRPYRVKKAAGGAIPQSERVRILIEMGKQVKREVNEDACYYYSPSQASWIPITDAIANTWTTEFNTLVAIVDKNLSYPNIGYSQMKEDISALGAQTPFWWFKEYLKALPEWDGVDRLPTLLPTLFKVDSHTPEYLAFASILPYWTIVSRNLCKAHETTDVQVSLILAGEPNSGKSSFTMGLVDERYYTNNLSMDSRMDEEKRAEIIHGNIVVEWSEMAGAKRADWELAKSFLTRKIDNYRIKYNKFAGKYPRRNAIIGTVNTDVLELPPTEAVWRRLLVVNVEGRGSVGEPMKYLVDNRDQLFAEAKHIWERGAFRPQPDSVPHNNGTLEDEQMANASFYSRERGDLKVVINTYLDKVNKDETFTDEEINDYLGENIRRGYSKISYIDTLKRKGWRQFKTKKNYTNVIIWKKEAEDEGV